MTLNNQNVNPPPELSQDTVADDNYVLNQLKKLSYDASDTFGNQIRRITRNELDIASQYQYSPERLRLFRDNTRQFVQYDAPITGFTDADRTWDLAPGSDETLHIESAESVSYVVNYETVATFAFELNQSLGTGDVVQVGPRTATDGWYMEQRGSDHTDTQVDIIQLDDGSTTTLASDVELDKPTTDACRYECRFNWYGVGSQVWTQTFTEDGTQRNTRLVETSEDGAFAPATGNVNLWYEITQAAGNSGVELSVGSMSMITNGAIANLTRSKPQTVSVSLPSTNDTWLPIYAIRLNPDVPNVNARFRSLNITSYENNTFLELVAASMSPDKTDATGFSIPAYHHAQNSAFQDTTNISEVPDDEGTQGTLGASDKYGGYTIATSSISSGGNTLSTQGDISAATEAKKSILGSDEIVFLARTGNAGATLRFTWGADQDW